MGNTYFMPEPPLYLSPAVSLVLLCCSLLFLT